MTRRRTSTLSNTLYGILLGVGLLCAGLIVSQGLSFARPPADPELASFLEISTGSARYLRIHAWLIAAAGTGLLCVWAVILRLHFVTNELRDLLQEQRTSDEDETRQT